MKRGEIYYANLGHNIGSEQSGTRPVIILQNDMGNRHAPTTIIAPLTTKNTKHKIPTHYWLDTKFANCPRDSMVLLEQVKVIDKSRLGKYIGRVSEADQKQIDKALAISMGLVSL